MPLRNEEYEKNRSLKDLEDFCHTAETQWGPLVAIERIQTGTVFSYDEDKGPLEVSSKLAVSDNDPYENHPNLKKKAEGDGWDSGDEKIIRAYRY